jgi:AraC-like DNA-binding protein
MRIQTKRVRVIHKAELHPSGMPGIEALTLVSNQHFPRHTHDQFGIGVIAFGAQRSWSAVGTVEASAGDVIMVNPGEVHDGVPLAGGVRGWQMIYLDPKIVEQDMACEFDGRLEIVDPVAQDSILVERFAHLFALITAARPDGFAIEENLLQSLVSVARAHGSVRGPNFGPPPHIRKAVERLNSAPEAPVTLAELAALCGVSRFQLLRGFARHIGITPHAYLMQRRVRLARQLLRHGQTPSDAAAHAGFADQSHMTRAFVRQLGVTPSRYRAAVALS